MDNNKPRSDLDDEYGDRTSKRSEGIKHQISYQDHIIRSYICSFCMRGFSNAQALGGHMNIHRRDRAKLRQLLEDKDNLDEQQQDSVREDDDDEKRDYCVDVRLGFRKLDAAEDDVELPDFVGKASRVNEENSSGSHHQNKKDTLHAMRDGSSSSYNEIEGLDLELRLGQSLKNTAQSREL